VLLLPPVLLLLLLAVDVDVKQSRSLTLLLLLLLLLFLPPVFNCKVVAILRDSVGCFYYGDKSFFIDEVFYHIIIIVLIFTP
jgi:hypothetical protein